MGCRMIGPGCCARPADIEQPSSDGLLVSLRSWVLSTHGGKWGCTRTGFHSGLDQDAHSYKRVMGDVFSARMEMSRATSCSAII
jgi:hypothetical protein